MRYLLDTHTFIWFNSEYSKINSETLKQIQNLSNEVFLSFASLLEIAIKVSLNKLNLGLPFNQEFYQSIADNQIHILPIQFAHLQRLTQLPWHHRDPFDRLIIAQALEEDLILISNDSKIKNYSVKTLW